jgi:hypothetical protein
MRSKPETFEAYADECERRAEALDDRRLKWLFSDLAFQWRELAATARLLKADSEATADLFQRMPHLPRRS